MNIARFLPPDVADRQQEKQAQVIGALAAMRAVRANAGVAAPPPPLPPGAGAAMPGIPPVPGAPAPPMPGPAVPVALGGPPLPPPAVPMQAPAPVSSLGRVGPGAGDFASPTEMTAPSQFFAEGGMVQDQSQDDTPLPPELERLVVPDTMMLELLLRGMKGETLRYAEGGLVMDLPGADMGTEEPADERELLRQIGEAGPAPADFQAWLDHPSDMENEIVADLLAAYQSNPQSAPILFQILKGLAEEEPQALPPSLLGMVGGGASTGQDSASQNVPPLPGKVGPMLAKRPPESMQYAAKGKRKNGVPLPPA